MGDDNVTYERTYDEAREIVAARIAHAGPVIRISRAFIDGSGRYPWLDPFIHISGDVLTATDDYGSRFIYRIHRDDYDFATDSYRAEWPD